VGILYQIITMQLDAEINHLLDLMPASGRMYTKLVSNPNMRSKVIDYPVTRLWLKNLRPIYINFELWQELSRSQRDLLLLHAVSRLINIGFFKPSLKQFIIAFGIVALIFEFTRSDVIGIIASGALVTYMVRRPSSGDDREEIQKADEQAIATAIRRGYSYLPAINALLESIERTAQLENRALSSKELLRVKYLKKLMERSPSSLFISMDSLGQIRSDS